jgi:hypothetical protein
MLDTEVEVINAQTEENLTGVVIEGIPYLYWLRVYKAFGISKTHAVWVMKRLTEGIHYKKFTREQFAQLSITVQVNSTVDNRARAFYFLTKEGMNRALIEIDTNRMIDPKAVEKVNEIRDKIANIYTRYQRGETLSIADEHPALPGQVEYAPVSVVLEDQMAIARIMIGEGVEPGIAKAMAFAVTENLTGCGDTLTPWRNLIRADPTMVEPALLNPTDIGNDIGGLSPNTVNKLLVRFGFQNKIGKEWVPTQFGKMYARFVPQEIKHNRGMVRKMQLKWLPSIVEKIRERMYYDQKGQTGLFTGHVGV